MSDQGTPETPPPSEPAPARPGQPDHVPPETPPPSEPTPAQPGRMPPETPPTGPDIDQPHPGTAPVTRADLADRLSALSA